jgi:HPt (histidine-containing phosphotransfer) domain-containing protein
MAEARPSVDVLLAVARADFARRLPAKTAEIEELVSKGAWDEARRASHKLRGSAATYGFPVVGAAAAAIEEALLGAAGNPSADVTARVGTIARDACVEAERCAREAP